MGLALKGCLKIGGACKRGSQENGGGGKKSGGKKKVIVSFLIWFATARTFLPAFFFHPHRFLATSFFATPPLFCTLPFYRHYFFVTSFLLPVFSGKVFLETATATKFFWEVAKKRWQKRGDKKLKKEVAQKRWQEWVAGKECDACAVRSGQICDAI